MAKKKIAKTKGKASKPKPKIKAEHWDDMLRRGVYCEGKKCKYCEAGVPFRNIPNIE